MKHLIKIFAVVLLIIPIVGCSNNTPPDLSPDAKVAFQATRVVKSLDVLRDASIAANELDPQLVTTDATREIVLWHKFAIQTIQTTPGGWKPTVKSSLYLLTCDAALGSGPCDPRLPASTIKRLSPYFGLVNLILNEVK